MLCQFALPVNGVVDPGLRRLFLYFQ